MKYLFVFVFVVLCFSNSDACTCINSRQLSEKEFKSYNLIVKGTIVSIDTADNYRKILIRVEDIYKGTKGQSEVLIMTELDPGMCGIEPKVNETWLIYSLEMAQYNYYTDVCTKSKNLNRLRSSKEIASLNKEMKFLEKKRR